MGKKRGPTGYKKMKRTEKVLGRLAKTLKPIVKPLRKALVGAAVGRVNRL
jgi:hypothetical protein